MAASISASVARNQEVAQIKRAGKEARNESKLAQKAVEAAAKAHAKSQELRQSQKQKIWVARHKLLDAWSKHALSLQQRGTSTGWFGEWKKT